MESDAKYDQSAAISPNSYDDNSAIRDDVNSAVNTYGIKMDGNT